MKISILLFISTCFTLNVYSQVIYVYHGRNNETFAADKSGMQLQEKSLRLDQGQTVRVIIKNPNPLFYKYTLKFEEQKLESESEDISATLAALGTILTSRIVAPAIRPGAAAPFAAPEPTFEVYKTAVNTLLEDIAQAQNAIMDSDIPELPAEAFSNKRTNGYVKAIDEINGLSSSKYHFNDPSLTANFSAALNDVHGLESITKKAFELLNTSLVQKVAEIKKLVPPTASRYIESTFIVTDKIIRVFLIITPLEENKKGLLRDVFSEEQKLEIATILPNYKRALLELVPVGSFLFAKNINEFYLKDDIVKSRQVTQTTITPSVIINVNVSTFGPAKQMAAGIGLGYQFSGDSKALNNIFFSTLFSYKDFFRIGVGLGWAKYPYQLKGAVEGQVLPSNIDKIADVIDYKEKFTGFLNLSFTGLNLTPKK
jgi:hypothetical protein